MNIACCDQSPKQTLKNLDDAIAELQAATTPLLNNNKLNTEIVALSSALNRVLASDLYSQLNAPPADNSAVDGYALNIDCFTPDKAIIISQRIPAGQAPKPLEQHTAARIFTGAHIPDGANCVVMQENVTLNDQHTHISVSGELSVGQNIRPMGQDIKSGDRILSKDM